MHDPRRRVSKEGGRSPGRGGPVNQRDGTGPLAAVRARLAQPDPQAAAERRYGHEVAFRSSPGLPGDRPGRGSHSSCRAKATSAQRDHCLSVPVALVFRRECPPWGHLQTCPAQDGMSASPVKVDITLVPLRRSPCSRDARYMLTEVVCTFVPS